MLDVKELKANPIKSESIGEKTCILLKKLIIQGKLAPGVRLKEEGLAAMLELSRTPLREAMHRLEIEGWVTKSHGGLKVSEISKIEARELYQIREVLEGLLAREAAKLMDDSKLAELEELIERMEKAAMLNDSKMVVDYGHRFHNAIYEASKNHKCMEILRNILDHIKRYRYLGVNSSPVRGKKAGDEHRILLEALKERDLDKVEQAMRDHIRQGGKAVLEGIDESLCEP